MGYPGTGYNHNHEQKSIKMIHFCCLFNFNHDSRRHL